MRALQIVVLTLGLLSGLSITVAQAFSPIDPLVRPRHGAGGYTFTTTLDYAPKVKLGEDGISIRNNLGINLAALYNITERLGAYGLIRASGNFQQQLVSDNERSSWETQLFAPMLGLQYTFPRQYEPTLSLDLSPPLFEQPLKVGLGLAGSLLKDPLIVDTVLTYHYANDGTNGVHDFDMQLGVGFVVNDDFSLRGEVTQNWTISRIVFPSTSVSASLNYKLDEQRSLKAGVGLSGLGSQTAWRTAVSYVFRK